MATTNTTEIKTSVPPEEDWRTHSTHQGANTEYPSVSYFQKDDKVWYSPPDGRGMLGPYVIVAHQANEMYTIKKVDTGVQHESVVPKKELSRV